VEELDIPCGQMELAGYVVSHCPVRVNHLADVLTGFVRWIREIPAAYRGAVLGESLDQEVRVENDSHCLGILKHYRSLMPLAQEARKPMFFLKPADGAIGGHTAAVQDCYRDFRELARRIAERCGFDVPEA